MNSNHTMGTKFNLLAMLLFPILASLFGIAIAFHNHLSILPFYSNVIAFVLGIPLSLFIAFQRGNTIENNIMQTAFIAVALLITSFLFSGVDEVNRWVFVGNLSLNISMICLPLLIYIISKLLAQQKTILPLLIMIGVELVLIVQPDAGQATAFGFGVISLFLFTKRISRLSRALTFGIGFITIMLAWNQADSLTAVEQVELILKIAFRNQWGLLGSIIIIFSLIILILPKIKYHHNDMWVIPVAYCVYFLTQLGVTWIGNFPVPIIGAGAGPVIGWYLILGFVIRNKMDELQSIASLARRSASQCCSS